MSRLASAFLLWLGIALWAVPVAAHAVLQSTDPEDRQVLAQAPSMVMLTFNEPVIPIAVQVLEGNGRVMTRQAEVEDGMLHIPLPADLAHGTYVVSWRVTSLDSHPVAGSLVFAVGPPPASWGAAPAEAPDEAWRIAFFLVRAALSMTLMLAAGGALSLVLLRPAPSLHPTLARLASAAIGLSVLAIGIQGGLLKGGAAADLLLGSTWQLGASITRGVSAAVAILGLSLVLLGLRRSWRPLLVLGAVVAISSLAFTGHTATASPRWLSALLLMLHTLLVAFWLGSLIPLLDGLAREKETKQLIARFSALAMAAVPLLIFAGVGLVFRHIESWDALTESRYGTILLIKVSLVALLLALAAVNKWVLTPQLPLSSNRLARAIRVELGLGLAILAVTALLSQTPPPGSEHAHEHDAGHKHGVIAHMEAGGHLAEIEVTPASAGRNLIVVRLDLPTTPKEVSIELAQPTAGIEPIRRRMTENNGAYILEGPELAVSGWWTVRIDVLVTDFDKAMFETEIPIR